MRPHAADLCRQAAEALLAAAEACLADGEHGSAAIGAGLIEDASRVHFALSWTTASLSDEAVAKVLFQRACQLRAEGFR